MKKMTEQNVKDALAGESQAHVKYSAFSEQAARENLPNVARAFKANSFAEQIHATNHLRALGGIGKTIENLAAAIAGEMFEIEEMYPAYINVAQAQKEKPAETVLNYALAAEKVHAGIYEQAKAAVSQGKDIDYQPIHVCPVCGFTMEGEAPEKCPVCGTPKSRFIMF
jgi:rubrerythrin